MPPRAEPSRETATRGVCCFPRWHECELLHTCHPTMLQEHFAHEKTPSPWDHHKALPPYCRVLWGGVFLSARYPCTTTMLPKRFVQATSKRVDQPGKNTHRTLAWSGSFLCLDRRWELAESKGPHRKSAQGYHADKKTHSPRTPQLTDA